MADTAVIEQSKLSALDHFDATASTPHFIYSYRQNSDLLLRTDLVTGEESVLHIPGYKFRVGCYWSEVPSGRVFITGGYPSVSEVQSIDTFKEFAVSAQPPMLTSRRDHFAMHHAQHLYVLGGFSGSCEFLSECERYALARSAWEALPPLPSACRNLSGVVVEDSLYALGGSAGPYLSLIQKLRLVELTWEVIELSLPQPACSVPCFVLDTGGYILLGKTLYSFPQLQVVRTVSENLMSYCGPSYFSRGFVYCSSIIGAPRRVEIGSLN
jgi:hypothetical protein